jgi:hypothetical protein
MSNDDSGPKGPNKGLKIPAGKSFLDNKPKKPSKEEFERESALANEKLNSHGIKAVDLSKSYLKLLDDKTLVANKSPLVLDIEKETMANLGQLAIDMNTDENEIEGIGSVGLCTLLLRCLFLQRDKINSLDYKISTLDQKVSELTSELENKINTLDRGVENKINEIESNLRIK